MKYILKEVVIEITKRCNLSCIHCGSNCTGKISKNELPTAFWVDFMNELSFLKVKKVVFSGGEPTLKKGFDKIISKACKIGLNWGLISNGFNLNLEMIQLLKNNDPFGIGISLDGETQPHNIIRNNEESYRNAVQSIDSLVKTGIKTSVVTTICKLNFKELIEMAPFLYNLGISNWQIQLMLPFGRMENREILISEEDFRKVCEDIIWIRREYPQMKTIAADCFGLAPPRKIRDDFWMGCGAGIFGIGISSEGNVTPCLSLRVPSMNCGNIKDVSLRKIWENDNNFSFNRNFKGEEIAGRCNNCEFLVNCRGGCASQSYSYYGKLHSAPFCYVRDCLQKRKEKLV